LSTTADLPGNELIINVAKCSSPQKPSTDFTEIWFQFLPGEGRPSPNFGLGLLSNFEAKLNNKE